MKANKQVKTAVGYARSATETQDKKSLSIEKQEKEIKDYCRRKGYELTGMFFDLGKSGITLDRPALNQVLDLAVHNEIKQVICFDTSRLSRNTFHYLSLKKIFEEHGVELKTICGPNFLDDSSSRFVDEILKTINSLYPRINRRGRNARYFRTNSKSRKAGK